MRALLLVGGLLLPLLFACGDDDDDVPDASRFEGIDAEQLLADAADAVTTLESFHFVLVQQDAVIPLPLGFLLEAAAGDVLLPDRLDAELEAQVQDTSVSIDLIAIESETWITNPFSRRWQKLPADLRDYVDFGALLPQLIPAIKDARVVDQTTLDGVDTYRLDGSANVAAFQAALPFSLTEQDVLVQVWLGIDDALPRRVRLIGPLIEGESAAALRQLDLSRFNQPVRIDPP